VADSNSGNNSFSVVRNTQPERRMHHADEFARALLAAPAGLTFADLLEAAPGAAPGDLAAWLGHAVTEGLVNDRGDEIGGERSFRLRARGRRLVGVDRRHQQIS
jgi:hypothetical protein